MTECFELHGDTRTRIPHAHAAPSVEEFFVAELDRCIAEEEQSTGFPAAKWMTAGARGCHDRAWWAANGPGLVRNFTTWYENNPDVSVWVTPDGVPAIELGLTVKFGDVEVKMFIDLILKIGTALVVVDLKSGAKTPDSLNQISRYACGVELAYGIRPRYGTFFMLKGVGKEEPKQFFLTPTLLDGYEHSVEFWARELSLFDDAVNNGTFVANVGDQCKRCGVAYACGAVGGKEASRFDPTYKEGVEVWKKRMAGQVSLLLSRGVMVMTLRGL